MPAPLRGSVWSTRARSVGADGRESTCQTTRHDRPARQASRRGFPWQRRISPATPTRPCPTPDHGEDSYEGRSRSRAPRPDHRRRLGNRAGGRDRLRPGGRRRRDRPPSGGEGGCRRHRAAHRGCRPPGLSFAGDLRDEDFATAIVDDVVEEFGGLDILVLNAAYQKDRESLDAGDRRDATASSRPTSTADLHRASRRAAPQARLVDHRDGIHPGLQSVAGPDRLRHDQGRAGRFVRALAEELGPKGIRVNAVAPGPIWTPLIPATGLGRRASATFGQDTPLGRAGQPAELAGAYVFLASEEASYVSAAVLPVTGGKHL